MTLTETVRNQLVGFQRVSIDQARRADQALYYKIAELCRGGVRSDHAGVRPIEVAIKSACFASDVFLLLCPQQLSLSSSGAPCKCTNTGGGYNFHLSSCSVAPPGRRCVLNAKCFPARRWVRRDSSASRGRALWQVAHATRGACTPRLQTRQKR